MQLNNLKALNSDQYDAAREHALARVTKRIGNRPDRKEFERELGALTTALDWIALLVFVAALAISSTHIIRYMGEQAQQSYSIAASPNPVGVYISENGYALIHQIGAILLAEAAAILFATMHSMTASSRAARHWSLRWLSIPLVLAFVAGVFVFVANVSSGVNLLVSIMPPLFTLGIAVRLESLIVAALQRREDVTRRYLEALSIYEASTADPTQHPDYEPILRQEIWTKLMSLSSNREYRDAGAAIKHAAVRREMERDTWAYHQDTGEVHLVAVESEREREPQLPFGNTALAVDALASITTMQSVNGHGTGVNGNNP